MTYACATQSTTMVATSPEPRMSAERRSRTSGLEPHDDHRQHDEREPDDSGDERGAVDPDERREEDLVDRRRHEPREADPDAVLDLGRRANLAEVRRVPGDDRDDRRAEADCGRPTDVPIRQHDRAGRHERDPELRQGPGADDTRDAHRDDRPGAPGALRLESTDDTTLIARNARP